MKVDNCTITIIIPTLNEELFIEQCIMSIKRQTYPFEQMEILVVDGGSKDKTRTIVSALSVDYPNVQLLDNPHRYQSAAFNIGVNHSSTKYIIRLDAHATYDTCYIERCIAILEAHPEYGNVGGICEIKPQNESLIARTNALLNHLRFGIGGAAFRIADKAQRVDSVPFGAFRKDIVEQIGGMREDLARGEDNEYNSRIRRAGYTVWLDPGIRSTYYARGTWVTSCKQMYANGVSIGQLFYVDRAAIRLRHLVPLTFVLAVIGAISIGCFTLYGWFLLAAILGSYLVAAIYADIDACRKYGWEYLFILPPMFLSIHLSYGVGTMVGLIKRQ